MAQFYICKNLRPIGQGYRTEDEARHALLSGSHRLTGTGDAYDTITIRLVQA